MSITSHMVGAAIEANIQEAIRLEEERAHGRELRQVIDRFQRHIDSKNEEIKQLRESMEMAVKVLKVNDKQLARLNEAARHNQHCAEFWQRKFIEQHVHARIERAKIDAFIDRRLPEIVQSAMEAVAAGSEQERATWEACTKVRARVSSSRLRTERMIRVVTAELTRLERSGASLDALAKQPEQIDMTQIAESYREGEVEGPRAAVADVIKQYAVTSTSA